MNQRIDGQIAVVTGAGRGIGRAIACTLAKAGAVVVGLGRNEEPLAETVRLIGAEGGAAWYKRADVTDRAAIDAAVDAIVSRHGRIDLWVNNAGQLRAIGPVWEVDPEIWWEDVTVNLYGTYLCTRRVVRQMLAQGAGRIVNIGGGGTMAPLLHASAYSASKAALARFTENLAWELRGTGVCVFVVNPGFVRTALTEYQLESEAGRKYMGYTRRMFERGRAVPPEEAGRVVAYLASGRADILSGHIFDVHVDLDALVADAAAVIREERHLLRLPRRPASPAGPTGQADAAKPAKPTELGESARP